MPLKYSKVIFLKGIVPYLYLINTLISQSIDFKYFILPNYILYRKLTTMLNWFNTNFNYNAATNSLECCF